MARELELAGAASAGGWLRWRKKHADIPPGTPCPNCETALQGPYCHACGQVAEDFHKSIFKLLIESVESLFHLDGRLLHTLPRLIAAPGRLTRSYLDGKRAYQIPPFRLFLVLLLVAFFVSHCTAKPEKTKLNTVGVPAAALEDIKREGVVVDPATGEVKLAAKPGEAAQPEPASSAHGKAEAPKAGDSDREVIGTFNEGRGKLTIDRTSPFSMQIEHWIAERAKAIRDDPERFGLILEIWAHRIAILALPVSALLLTVLFVFQRRFFVFDHLVFSMHSLSFQLLLLSLLMALGALSPVFWWLILLMPVHLFVHMRGVYATSVPGTLVRMALLFAGSVVGFSFLLMLWIVLGVNEMAGGH
jgi:hypothetical protein